MIVGLVKKKNLDGTSRSRRKEDDFHRKLCGITRTNISNSQAICSAWTRVSLSDKRELACLNLQIRDVIPGSLTETQLVVSKTSGIFWISGELSCMRESSLRRIVSSLSFGLFRVYRACRIRCGWNVRWDRFLVGGKELCDSFWCQRFCRVLWWAGFQNFYLDRHVFSQESHSSVLSSPRGSLQLCLLSGLASGRLERTWWNDLSPPICFHSLFPDNITTLGQRGANKTVMPTLGQHWLSTLTLGQCHFAHRPYVGPTLAQRKGSPNVGPTLALCIYKTEWSTLSQRWANSVQRWSYVGMMLVICIFPCIANIEPTLGQCWSFVCSPV